jgi:PhzF family phenazine biosynthesis protein
MTRAATIPIYQVDAFTDVPFKGNPAAVCLNESELPADLMQAIAAENNVSETAFLVPAGDDWALRWFTPATEVDLCGHGTLASAHVLFHEIDPDLEDVVFHTKSGALPVRREGDWIVLDFPARAVTPATEVPEALSRGLGRAPDEVFASGAQYLAVFEAERDVAALRPDFDALLELEADTRVIATAPGDEADFVSRYFAPSVGVPEDPVTGSAHCVLAPFWAGRLGTKRLVARQISARGGLLRCRDHGERVEIGGKTVLVMRGELEL